MYNVHKKSKNYYVIQGLSSNTGCPINLTNLEIAVSPVIFGF